MNIAKYGALLLMVGALTACKVEITVPEGGRVASVSNAHRCEENNSCQVEINDIYFTEKFEAIPNEGYEFAGWEKKPKGLCGGIKKPCVLSTKAFSGNAALMGFLESDETFYLEPIFERVSEGPIESSEGLWLGSTNNGQTIQGLILADGSYYFIYSVAGNSSLVGGVVIGNSTTTDGYLTSTSSKDFNLEGAGVLTANVSGTVVSRKSFDGTVTYPNGYRTSFNAIYSTDFETEPSLQNLSGRYNGTVAFSLGYESAFFDIGPDGSISGRGASGCQFTGSAAPMSSGNVYNIKVRFGGYPCYFSNLNFNGIAYLDQLSNRIYVILPNESRSDGLFFIGS